MINHFGKYSIFLTGMGWIGLVSTDRGIFTSILPQEAEKKAEKLLLSRISFRPQFSRESHAAEENMLKAYFDGVSREIRCDIDLSWATPFQKRVLEVVYTIPWGSVRTYGEVAHLAGTPGGARAVGGALASNMLPVIIPCHRVIRKDGLLGGFTGAGPEVKARLLFLEGANLKTS